MQARIKAVRELCKIYPVSLIVVEDVRHDPKIGKAAKHFSTTEIGKKATYQAFAGFAPLKLATADDTAALREKVDLTKIGGSNRPQVFEAQAVDATALAAGEIGCMVGQPPFYVWTALRFNRRSLHRRHFQKGGKRPRFGGTTNGTFFRKGDWVEVSAKTGGFRGWVCGLPTDKTPLIAVANTAGKRVGKYRSSQVRLLARSGGFTWKEGSGVSSPA